MGKRHSEKQDDTEINITPMLDIVFIMLIFFIVTTSFVKETGIDPSRPMAETAKPKTRGNILIGVTELGDIWFNKQQIELTMLRQRVEEAAAENPERSAVIIADEGAPTGVVIDIMDQVALGGVIDISVAAEVDGS